MTRVLGSRPCLFIVGQSPLHQESLGPSSGCLTSCSRPRGPERQGSGTAHCAAFVRQKPAHRAEVHRFFVSCALVSLSPSVTGKKRRKTKRGQRRCCTANWCKVKQESQGTQMWNSRKKAGGHPCLPFAIRGQRLPQKMVLAVDQHH